VRLPDPGQSMYYDPLFFKEFMRMSMFWWRQGYRYQSNWRVLHVDGMEGYIFSGVKLPQSTGKSIKFFSYKETA
jgi:hypothetical protein